VVFEMFEALPYWSCEVTVIFPEHCPAIIANAFEVITNWVGDAAFTVRLALPVALFM
jgi:hypothetical protein